MRKLLAAFLAVPLLAAAPRGTIALGVGAASSNEIVVKIDGKNATIKLAGVGAGTYAAQAFLQCLVANRVIRVDRVAGRATMLDGSSVSDHVAEFLQTQTSSDPCALGKAAYVAQTPALAGSVVVNPPGSEATAAPAKRQGHVSFPGGTMGPITMNTAPEPEPAQPRKYVPPAATSTQPSIYHPPSVGTVQVQPGSTYTPMQPSTYTPPTGSTTTIPTGSTYTPPQAGTTTIPSTTTNPP